MNYIKTFKLQQKCPQQQHPTTVLDNMNYTAENLDTELS